MAAIKPIGAADVHKICSGQVIIDLRGGVKELVENAIDANAKKVEVRLSNFGFDSFEVIDDGTGIAPESRETVCLKHWTSKIRSFEEVSFVSSFGFRGEALSSLCECAESLVITTRCAEDETAVKLVYDQYGKLESSSVAARGIGTTVTVTGLFKRFPVRRKEFEKHLKKYYADLLLLMQAYGIISTGVRISVVNHQTSGQKSVALATQGADRLGPNLASIFGHKFLEELVPIEFEFTLLAKRVKKPDFLVTQQSEKDEDDEGKDEEMSQPQDPSQVSTTSSTGSNRQDISVVISGYVSRARAGIGRSNADRQFFYINGRPADLKKFAKAINDVWRQYEMNHKPACALNVKLPPGSYDVNLTPDKREILIEREQEMIEMFKSRLNQVWDPTSRTFERNSTLQETLLTGTQSAQQQTQSSSSSSFAEKQSQSPPIIRQQQNKYTQSSILKHGFTRVIESKSEDDEEEVVVALEDGNEEESGRKYVKRSRVDDLEEEDVTTTERRQKKKANKPMEDITIVDDEDVERTNDEFAIKDKEKEDQAVRNVSASMRSRVQEETAFDKEEEVKEDEQVDNKGDDELDIDSTTKQKTSLSSKQNQSPTKCDCAHDHGHHDHGDDDERSPRIQRAVDLSDDLEQQQQSPLSTSQGMISNPSKLIIGSAQSLLEMERTMKETTRKSRPIGSTTNNQVEEDKFAGADLSATETDAIAKLSSVFNKSDFQRAEIIGQFNRGFIIARVDEELFILDQHASDEKFRFETLQNSTTIEEQPLIAPLPVELSATEAQIVRDYREIFHANGFEFIGLDDDGNDDEEVKVQEERSNEGILVHPPNRIMLTKIPHSKQTMFGPEDVRDLASLLRDEPPTLAHRIPRLPKLRTMFASRACRSAIMVGDALPPTQMARVVANLAKLDQPWNCPHGRPTMRHLVHLPDLHSDL